MSSSKTFLRSERREEIEERMLELSWLSGLIFFTMYTKLLSPYYTGTSSLFMRLCDWFLRKLVTWRSKELRKMMDTCRMRIWGVRVCPLRCVISLSSRVVFSYRLCVFWVQSWRLGGTRARGWRCCDLSCDRWSAYPLASWVFLWCRWRARIGGYPSRSRRKAISSIGPGRCGVAISLSSWIAHSCEGFRGIQASTLGMIPRSITIIPASIFSELPCSCRVRGWSWQVDQF